MRWETVTQEETNWLVHDDLPGVRVALRMLEGGEFEICWAIKASKQDNDQPVTLPMAEEWASEIGRLILDRLLDAGCVFLDDPP